MQHIAHREEGGVVLDALVLHTTSRSLKQLDQFQRDFLGPVLVVLLEHIEGVLVLELFLKNPYVRISALLLFVFLFSLFALRGDGGPRPWFGMPPSKMRVVHEENGKRTAYAQPVYNTYNT